MENTALNGTTTTTTKDQEDWKQKKGYTPLIVLTTVLLVLAFYAGQSRGSNVAGGTTRGATATASLTYSSTSSGKLFSSKEIAKAWKKYDKGAYKDGCANAMAIAFGEGIQPAGPLNYICDPAIPKCKATSKGCLGLDPTAWCWGKPMTLDEFADAPLFDIDQTAEDGQKTLGPWQTTSDVPHTDDISVRIGETVNYLTTLCNPRCPGKTEASQCTPNSAFPDRPITTIFDDAKIKWCGCATTAVKNPDKQTYGYSGRCSQGAADHYTKYTHSEYQSIANKICDSV